MLKIVSWATAVLAGAGVVLALHELFKLFPVPFPPPGVH